MQHVEQWPLDRLIEYARNPRNHDVNDAVNRIASAIHEFGFRVPVLAKSDGSLIDGHLRLKAARKLGMETVPVLIADDMTDIQIKAFRLSVNKMAELAEWDDELLALELGELEDLDFDLELTGFSLEEISSAMGIMADLDGSAPDAGIDYKENYSIIVMCPDEAGQQASFERLTGMGFECKVLVN